jgi:muconolactone delta-isomerase
VKYLVVGTTGEQVPLKKAAAIWRAAKEWMRLKMENGMFDCHFVFADSSGGFIVSNAKSHEEVEESLMDFPAFPIVQWEVTPLCEWENQYDRLVELYQKTSA